MILIVLLIVLAVIATAVIGIYNGLVRLNVQANNAWADIHVQLKRRYDLIPNVVETVVEAAFSGRLRVLARGVYGTPGEYHFECRPGAPGGSHPDVTSMGDDVARAMKSPSPMPWAPSGSPRASGSRMVRCDSIGMGFP